MISAVFAESVQCRDITRDIEWNQIPLATLQIVPYQTTEITQHGRALSLNDPSTLNAFKETLLMRDGVYVFLLDRTGALLIDHQLPHTNLGSYYSFYGTHRGLYNQRVHDFGSCEVVFAGELLVSNGRVEWISDNSAFYYERPKITKNPDETERDFRFRTKMVRQRLIETATLRLKTLHQLLWSWGWVDGQTRIKQTEKTPQDFDDVYRNSEYTVARNRARFESLCRAEAFCWQTYQRIDVQLKRYGEVGGYATFSSRLPQLLRKDAVKTQILVQFFSTINEVGLMGMLSKQINIESRQIPSAVEGFSAALNWYLSELEFL